MPHVLDNPIYNALISAHRNFSVGTEDARHYMSEIASFAGLKNNSAQEFETLYQLSQPESLFIVFSKNQLQIPSKWKLVKQIDMFQLVYESNNISKSSHELTELSEAHVDEMIALVKLTEPGPFLARAIDFGNYTGIFQEGKLVSMAGHRFNPTPYIEVSAVCTHPEHLGKGYAFDILNEQIKRIVAKMQIPFLHVRNDNVGAIKLYQKLGFQIRTEMIAYVIRKAE